MKKLIDRIKSSLGLRSNEQAGDVRLVDPNTILLSIPTLADGLPDLEDARDVGAGDLVLHEDDWTQVEFFPIARLAEMQTKMRELKACETANRTDAGWKDAYVRKIDRMPVVDRPGALTHLESVLGAASGKAPLLAASDSITGRVRNAFHMTLGGNVALYGLTQDGGIPLLGASVGENPDNTKLVAAFAKLHASDKLVLVDWPGQMILMGVADGGKIEVWRP